MRAGSGVGRECSDIKIFSYETPVNSYMVIVTGISVDACRKCRIFSRMFASQCNGTVSNPANSLSSAKIMIKNNLFDSSHAYIFFPLLFENILSFYIKFINIFCVKIVLFTISRIPENLYNHFLITSIEIRWD